MTPAGKAMRKLQLLSGGEKSLVALAFVFSVFMARPSPFYILDEVEAALDDANIDRFLQLVRRFSSRAQFIVVTHQKRTMDAADVLYGVSMARGGITKVVSRRMPEADRADARSRRRGVARSRSALNSLALSGDGVGQTSSSCGAGRAAARSGRGDAGPSAGVLLRASATTSRAAARR